jgi:hypothetical protein
MTGVEGLCDIGRRKLDNDSLLSLGWVLWIFQSKEFVVAEVLFALEGGGNEDLRELIDFEVEL